MCGIFALVGPSQRHQCISSLKILQHRGPDCTDFYQSSDGKAFLGHTLLSISASTASGGKQPMQTSQWVIAFNGEIYNHKELRASLIARGSTLSGDSDTEVLLCGIEHQGLSFLETVEGCWAIVLYQKHTGKLFFGRDPLGEKQLMYRLSANTLILASEAKAILATQNSVSLDGSRIISDLIFDFFSNRESTYFLGIKNCKPGTIYSYEPSVGMDEFHVYKIQAKRPQLSLRAKLASSVVSMVPERENLAVVLSGGLDSSIITTLLKTELNDKRFDAVTASYKGVENEDLVYAKALVEHLGGISHHAIDIAQKDILENFLKVQRALEEPLQDQVYVAQFLVYRLISNMGIRVALNGQGADEFWGGYHYCYGLGGVNDRGAEAIIDYFLERANKRRLHELLNQAEIIELIEKNMTSRWSKLDRIQNLLMEGHLQAMVCHEDKLSMAAGVEVRFPYLNQDLVSHALGLHPADKVGEGLEKIPLRHAMNGILTDAIRMRPKQPFPDSPISSYLDFDRFGGQRGGANMFSNSEVDAVAKNCQKMKWRMKAINEFSGMFTR